ncbi:VOC family protein [Haloterrigena salifodinae]|uniref:VOC family protein n=1 Tax=Haloterrigena salifodinae TaxID=2675099 RepID=UPI000F89AA9C|nr:VOC family protein [Haloterrigena salifodinae]
MTSIEKITFACNSPDRLATFWERALERDRVPLPAEPPDETDDPDHVLLAAPDDRSLPLLFKRLPKGSTEDIPIHLDLATEEKAATVERLEELGASAVETKRERFADQTEEWTVMEDPEGNGFCVCDRAPR